MMIIMMMYNKNLLRCVVNHVGSNVSQRVDDGSRNVAEGKSLNGWRGRVIEVMMMIVRMHYSKRPPDLYSCLLESPPLWLYTAWLASTVVSLKSRMMSSYTWVAQNMITGLVLNLAILSRVAGKQATVVKNGINSNGVARFRFHCSGGSSARSNSLRYDKNLFPCDVDAVR